MIIWSLFLQIKILAIQIGSRKSYGFYFSGQWIYSVDQMLFWILHNKNILLLLNIKSWRCEKKFWKVMVSLQRPLHKDLPAYKKIAVELSCLRVVWVFRPCLWLFMLNKFVAWEGTIFNWLDMETKHSLVQPRVGYVL